MSTTRVLLISCWLAASILILLDPDLCNAQEEQNVDYAALVGEIEVSLPQWDESVLLPPPSLVFWTEAVDAELLALAVDDAVPEYFGLEGGAHVYRDEIRAFKVDLDGASLRYSSLNRKYVPGVSPNTPVSDEIALAVLRDAADVLGLPSDEFGREDTASVLVSSFGPGNPGQLLDTVIVGTMVTIHREKNGMDVSGSIIRGLVSNDGEIIRMRIRWPDFQLNLVGGETLRTREATATEVAGVLWEAGVLGDGSTEFHYKLAYCPTVIGGNSGFYPCLIAQALTHGGETPFSFPISLIEDGN